MLSGTTWFVGSIAGPISLLGGVLWIFWDRWRARRQVASVKDEPDGEPYRVFTREFDLELDAAQVPNALRDASSDFYKGWSDRRGDKWRDAIAAAECAPVPDLNAIRDAIAPCRNVTVTLLVDQSGSMQGDPIMGVVTALRGVIPILQEHGISNEILGFSTAGWHGGRAREQWIRSGRPKRPGRLCALLHIIYKCTDEPEWSAESQRAMLHPDILRENVDGEALQWASARLESIPALRKLLIVISDGAPVDDSTLIANGPSYLVRHLHHTITSMEADGKIILGAIGIDHDVGHYYAHSRKAGVGTIAIDLAVLIGEMAGTQNMR